MNGVAVAGATIGGNDTWEGKNSTVSIISGERAYIDTTVMAGKQITVEGGQPGNDDDGLSVVITTGGGLVAKGVTSNNSGGLVSVKAEGDIQLMGAVLSGGVSVDNQITWGAEDSSIHIEADGQAWIGGNTVDIDNNPVEVGGRLYASQEINIIGGVHAEDGEAVKMPGSAHLTVKNDDGSIHIESGQDAVVSAVMVAGGEVITHSDSSGMYQGVTLETYDGDSSITIQAENQIRLGRDLYAGKLIDLRGGVDPVDGTSGSEWEGQGLVLYGSSHLKTWQEDSTINLNASGDISILMPGWQQEIKADGFPQFADGHLTHDATLDIVIDLGTHVSQAQVTLTAAETQDNASIAALKKDLQDAIDNADFTVIESTSGDPALNSTHKVDQLTVRLSDGSIMLTSEYEFTLKSGSQGASYLGFTQLANSDAKSNRMYAVDAPKEGSVINIGSQEQASGSIYIAGWLRGYEGVNFYSSENADGSQDLEFDVTGVLETLSGGITFDLGTDGIMKGNLIARGRGSDITIHADETLQLHGDITAQDDIFITAGSTIVDGKESLYTHGTSRLNTIDPDGTISLIGVNDVRINSKIGANNPELGLLEVKSTNGTLILDQEGGWLETGAQLNLIAKKLDLSGVIKSNRATPAVYDNELYLKADESMNLSGSFDLDGSMKLESAGNIELENIRLLINSPGQHLEIEAKGDVLLGNINPTQGDTNPHAVVLQADSYLDIETEGILHIASDAQLYTKGDNSAINIESETLALIGTVYAGAAFDETNGYSWTGKAANIDIETENEIVIGGKGLDGSYNLVDFGGRIVSTGQLYLDAGTDENGVGISQSALSAVYVDATADGTFADNTDGDLQIKSDGDIQIYNFIDAKDDGADAFLSSKGLIIVDGLVRADDELKLSGGANASDIGVLITAVVLDDQLERVSGGTLDVNEGGSITVLSKEQILINGVIGQLTQQDDTFHANAGAIQLTSFRNDISVVGYVDASNQISLEAKNINVLAGSRIKARGQDSEVVIKSTEKTYIAPAESQEVSEGYIEAEKNIHLVANTARIDGLIKSISDTGNILFSIEEDLTVVGTILSENSMNVHVGVNIDRSLAELSGNITMDDLLGGTAQIKQTGVLNAKGELNVLVGYNFIVNASTEVGDMQPNVTPIITTDEITLTIVSGYQQVAIGTISVPEISWVKTTIVEQVDQKLVDVGNRYYTMTTTLSQIGYYNPNAPDELKFREFFIEGIDYSNDAGQENSINWTLYGVNDVMTSDDTDKDVYRSFSQLNDAQRKAVLNTLGYKPLYDFSYTNAKIHTARGINTPKIETWVPKWNSLYQQYESASQSEKLDNWKVYAVDVDGWRDKLILMPEGANQDVLRVESIGEATYLDGDTTRDGESDGSWISSSNPTNNEDESGPTGELVGRYHDDAEISYTQDKSTFNGTTLDPDSPVPSHWSDQTKSSEVDTDKSEGRWSVEYIEETGQRIFEIEGRTDETIKTRAPNWSWEDSGESESTDPLDNDRDTHRFLLQMLLYRRLAKTPSLLNKHHPVHAIIYWLEILNGGKRTLYGCKMLLPGHNLMSLHMILMIHQP